MSFPKNLLVAFVACKFLTINTLTTERRDSKPNLPYDDNTTKDCTWWIDYDKSQECAQMLEDNWIDLEIFRRWNPSVGPDCTGLTIGRSYCIEAPDSPISPTATSTSTSTLITTDQLSSLSETSIVTSSATTTRIPVVSSTSTTTSAGNGVETPQPAQPGMVKDCARFHWIAKGVVCSQVISYQKITREDFVRWNSILSDCSDMLTEVHVCVGIISSATTTPPTTTKPTTTTAAGNGIATPQPTQPGMVTNCARFHWIASGVTCSQVTSYQKISLADFVKWNPTVRSDCTGMQANVNVCVGIIGGTTTPTTTTTAGNGIQTPQPTQPGMVTNCKKFHYAETGVVCSQITSFNHISLADFVKWNPGVGTDCKTMWAKTFTCVGV